MYDRYYSSAAGAASASGEEGSTAATAAAGQLAEASDNKNQAVPQAVAQAGTLAADQDQQPKRRSLLSADADGGGMMSAFVDIKPASTHKEGASATTQSSGGSSGSALGQLSSNNQPRYACVCVLSVDGEVV